MKEKEILLIFFTKVFFISGRKKRDKFKKLKAKNNKYI